jgi:hypothetical protein
MEAGASLVSTYITSTESQEISQVVRDARVDPKMCKTLSWAIGPIVLV